ncbi:hypothetical protein GCM10023350_38610 [Nocardioides endophyticus]|uniref:Uncharacterized protein n=1 Tax=Nocardioides endophyticus TaxID=1353775 RepID=A0ABP8Z8K8_9ACTN
MSETPDKERSPVLSDNAHRELDGAGVATTAWLVGPFTVVGSTLRTRGPPTTSTAPVNTVPGAQTLALAEEHPGAPTRAD